MMPFEQWCEDAQALFLGMASTLPGSPERTCGACIGAATPQSRRPGLPPTWPGRSRKRGPPNSAEATAEPGRAIALNRYEPAREAAMAAFAKSWRRQLARALPLASTLTRFDHHSPALDSRVVGSTKKCNSTFCSCVPYERPRERNAW